MLRLYTQQSLLTTFTTNKAYDLVSNNMKSKKRAKTEQTSHELHRQLNEQNMSSETAKMLWVLASEGSFEAWQPSSKSH